MSPLWHRDVKRRCLTCVEHGGSFDGGCEYCGYADPRWVPLHPDFFEPAAISRQNALAKNTDSPPPMGEMG